MTAETMEQNQLIQLTEELAVIIEKRRLIGKLLQEARRKDRTGLLEQHREIKEAEYKLGEQLAELKLNESKATGKPALITIAGKRLQRLRSRLSHPDWLLWTRSIWKFKDMESDAKTGEHPAQFSAKVPERLIAMYSFQNETVLDPFVGSGTSCVVAKQMGRNSIGLDINPKFIEASAIRLQEQPSSNTQHQLIVGDARRMNEIPDNSIQLIVAHPPYWNCVKISSLTGDLSNCDNDSYGKFLDEMRSVTEECFRVLEDDRVCAFMIGDVMRKVGGVTRLFPLHADLLTISQQVGFLPWDVYIVETKMRDSGGMPMMGSYPYPHKLFSQFAHNYIILLRKPIQEHIT